MFFKKFLPLLLTMSALGAQAATVTTTIFEDDFDANALSVSSPTPIGWSIVGGSVDIIGFRNYYDWLPNNGRYIDLDGSTRNSGELVKSFNLTAGVDYTAFFDLAGSQVGPSSEIVDVLFGDTYGVFTLTKKQNFTQFSLNFTPTTTAAYDLVFSNRSSDNMGALLDDVLIISSINVPIAAVPEPNSTALVLAALGVVGFMLRKKN